MAPTSKYISIYGCGEEDIVRIEDTAGNPLTSTAGALNVNVVGETPATGTEIIIYNEITSVAPSVESTVLTYTTPGTGSFYLQVISSSASNNSIYRIYRNGTVIDKQYGAWTQYNFVFDYRTSTTVSPGLLLSGGDIIRVTGISSSPSLGSFNAKIQLVEIA